MAVYPDGNGALCVRDELPNALYCTFRMPVEYPSPAVVVSLGNDMGCFLSRVGLIAEATQPYRIPVCDRVVVLVRP